MAHTIHNIGVADQLGTYSDAIEVRPNLRWLVTSGTPGLAANAANGELPDNFVRQAEIAWENIIAALKSANMSVGDIVKLTQYFTRADDIPHYRPVRSRYLGDARPASMLLVVSQLVRADMLFELEVTAAAV